jgi:hypothetical protein
MMNCRCRIRNDRGLFLQNSLQQFHQRVRRSNIRAVAAIQLVEPPTDGASRLLRQTARKGFVGYGIRGLIDVCRARVADTRTGAIVGTRVDRSSNEKLAIKLLFYSKFASVRRRTSIGDQTAPGPRTCREPALCAFPIGAHDDQVDAAAAAFRALVREPQHYLAAAQGGVSLGRSTTRRRRQ